MIIESRADVLQLTGKLHKDEWPTIRTAARLLLREHPAGVIIDCNGLTDVSKDGAATFLNAIEDIAQQHTRIVVVGIPERAREVCRGVPGVRSQMPVAETLQEARESLHVLDRVARSKAREAPATQGAVLVPLMSGIALEYGAELGSRIAASSRALVRLVYLLEVARHLPLSAPLAAQEKEALASLNAAVGLAARYKANTSSAIERVRDPVEWLVKRLHDGDIGTVVIGAQQMPAPGEARDKFHGFVDALIQRAPCEVVVGRGIDPGATVSHETPD
ncbi:MAG: universal stress protein [Armatimonadetes bacterium]|nr:universal stress protein [Armatimonadota bacterium]MDE2205880.1 universal stress protein [Armatimonadota bacterium]